MARMQPVGRLGHQELSAATGGGSLKNEQYAPFVLFDEDAEEARLYLYEDAMSAHQHLFARHGWECNGYSWAGVAREVAKSFPEGDGSLALNPEAGMLAVYGPPAALRRLASELHALVQDSAALDRAIEQSEVD